MLAAFGGLSHHIKIKKKPAVIDNSVFRLYYRASFAIFLAATVLVSSRQYIGEHIRCIADNGVAPHVIETYCFFTTTFTVVRHLNETAVAARMVPHSGIGPVEEGDPIIVHAYYQWVPFVLFLQALMFYLPHFVWKRLEGGQILSMVNGFENAAMALRETALKLSKTSVPSVAEFEDRVNRVRKAFIDHLNLNQFWGLSLVTCEALNVFNLIFQIYFTNMFLGGGFIGLGPRILDPYDEDTIDPLEIIFPKVTKCTFFKYGASGSLQNHDALCVMALNIINEKIYIFVWFWMVFLIVVTSVGILWRIASFLLHARSPAFNKWAFPTVVDRNSLRTITQRCSFSDWLFLFYMGHSMNSFVFRELIKGLAFEMEEDKIVPGPSLENGAPAEEKLIKKDRRDS